MIIISHFHMPFFFVENILCYTLILMGQRNNLRDFIFKHII